MNILPILKEKTLNFKLVFEYWQRRVELNRGIIFASNNKLILSLLYMSSLNKKRIIGIYTTAQEVLSKLATNRIGILVCTIDLMDGSGDDLIRKATAMQPDLRTILIVEHNNFTEEQSRNWFGKVIIAAQDLCSPDSPVRQAMLAALANTTYRSMSIAERSDQSINQGGVILTNRERDMLKCFALGLSNKEAAARLNLSPHSTKTYGKQLLNKLKAKNRQLALLKAYDTL